MSTTDPFRGRRRGGPARSDLPFPQDRLEAAGLDEDSLAAFRAAYDEATVEQQQAFAGSVGQVDDESLREHVATIMRAMYDPGEHTVAEVKDAVEADPYIAEAVLERERAGSHRKTLIAYLEDAVKVTGDTTAQPVDTEALPGAADPTEQLTAPEIPEGDGEAVEVDPAPLADPDNVQPAVDAETGGEVADTGPSDALEQPPVA